MWYSFLLLGSAWFWLLVLGATGALIFAVEADQTIIAGCVAAAFFVTAYLLAGFNPLVWIYHNPISTAVLIAVYLLGGVLWSIGKWYFFVSNKRDQARDLLDEFLESNSDTGKYHSFGALPDPLKTKFLHLLQGNGLDIKPPSPRNHKERLILWMGYWPFSMIGTLIQNPIRKFFRWIYGRLISTYQTISNKIYGDLFQVN